MPFCKLKGKKTTFTIIDERKSSYPLIIINLLRIELFSFIITLSENCVQIQKFKEKPLN